MSNSIGLNLFGDLLKECLFSHDCVIVQDLGAFITRNKNANLNIYTNQITPGGSTVFFNSKINQHDGIFTDFISKKLNYTYSDVNLLISNCVEEIKLILENKKNYSFKEIGSLFLGNENQLLFLPDAKANFSKSHFGLEPIICKKVEKTYTEISDNGEFLVEPNSNNTKKDSKVVLESENATKVSHIKATYTQKENNRKYKKDRKWLPKIAASIAVVGFLSLWAWYFINNKITSKNINNNKNKEQEANVLSNDTNPINILPQNEEIIVENKTSNVDIDSNKNIPTEINKTTTELKKNENVGNYAIIIGAYTNIELAEKHKNELLNKNIETTVLDMANSYLKRLIYSRYKTLDEANLALDDLKTKEEFKYAFVKNIRN